MQHYSFVKPKIFKIGQNKILTPKLTTLEFFLFLKCLGQLPCTQTNTRELIQPPICRGPKLSQSKSLYMLKSDIYINVSQSKQIRSREFKFLPLRSSFWSSDTGPPAVPVMLPKIYTNINQLCVSTNSSSLPWHVVCPFLCRKYS